MNPRSHSWERADRFDRSPGFLPLHPSQLPSTQALSPGFLLPSDLPSTAPESCCHHQASCRGPAATQQSCLDTCPLPPPTQEKAAAREDVICPRSPGSQSQTESRPGTFWGHLEPCSCLATGQRAPAPLPLEHPSSSPWEWERQGVGGGAGRKPLLTAPGCLGNCHRASSLPYLCIKVTIIMAPS